MKKKRFIHHDMEAKYLLDLAPVLSGDHEYPAVPEDMSCCWLLVPKLGWDIHVSQSSVWGSELLLCSE